MHADIKREDKDIASVAFFVDGVGVPWPVSALAMFN